MASGENIIVIGCLAGLTILVGLMIIGQICLVLFIRIIMRDIPFHSHGDISPIKHICRGLMSWDFWLVSTYLIHLGMCTTGMVYIYLGISGENRCKMKRIVGGGVIRFMVHILVIVFRQGLLGDLADITTGD